MRIRSIKPEFWRSDDIAALPISARLLFIGLWSYVDDNGVGSDKLTSITADLFAEDLSGDTQETLRRVSGDYQALEDRGLIVRYRAEGKPLVYITGWERHQLVSRPSKGHEYPLPPAELLEPFALLPTPSGDPPETLNAGAGEQGSRGAGERDGAEAPLSPFCGKHPNGTDKPCRACGTARVAYEVAKDAEKRKPTPMPPKPGYVEPHEHKWLADNTCMLCTERKGAA